ncbi:AMP-binding protein [Pseudoalteromonas spongiae]|uniref:AMP-binding protein n=1 Tax=Pseudoalteromonas spongiae TaxID=298657 RepID=UPI0037363B62
MLNVLKNHNQSDIAVITDEHSFDYLTLNEKIEVVCDFLQMEGVARIALCAANSLDWLVVDLAAMSSNLLIVPVPDFFSEEQKQHVIYSCKVSHVISEKPTAYSKPLVGTGLFINEVGYHGDVALPEGTQKVTFTSGSTGTPKGVCLSRDNQLTVAKSLIDVIGLSNPKHLSLLPFSTLLENIAGIYAPLLCGGTVKIISDSKRGFSGSRLVDMQALLATIAQSDAHTLNLVPELLKVLVVACKQGWQPPQSLKFVAVGGGKVDKALIAAAREYGLPVCQGYGLSEASSVVALNTLEDNSDSSVGKLLPHVTGTIENGELVLKGNAFLGYLGEPNSWYQDTVHTGDLAEFKGDKLYLNGRAKNLIINSLGRNISPEWPESLLDATGLFSQAVVIGDGLSQLVALLMPLQGVANEHITASLARINQALPDYAKLNHFILLDAPLSYEQGMLTENGRFKRQAINQTFLRQASSLVA